MKRTNRFEYSEEEKVERENKRRAPVADDFEEEESEDDARIVSTSEQREELRQQIDTLQAILTEKKNKLHQLEANDKAKLPESEQENEEYVYQPPQREVRRSAPGADDLVPDGASDAEPNWDGCPEEDFPYCPVHMPSLAIADFAGRYEVMDIRAGEDGDSKIINKKRAYAEITPTGEGKFYLDKSVNGYFSLEKVVQEEKKKSSAADVHWTKGKLMRQWEKKRGHEYEGGVDGEDTAVHVGDIFFTDHSKENITLMIREEDEYDAGMAIMLKRIASK